MESMKREKQWKWLAWLAMAAVTALAVWGAGVSVQAKQEQAERDAHYASSVHFEDDEALARGTAEYFQDRNTRFDPETLEVRRRAELGDYMALLCADQGGEWCMSVWRRDELFPDRYRPIGGRSQMDTGMKGALVHNFGDAENAVVVASGAELPEEVWSYTWVDGGTIHRSGPYTDQETDSRGILDIYVMTLEDPYNPVGPGLTLYDDAGTWIWDDFR